MLWYKNKIPSFFILSIVTVLMSLSAVNLKFSDSSGESMPVFTVEFTYYGMDCDKIERLITIPLEEEVFSIPGLYSVDSVCEFGTSRTVVKFESGIKKKRALHLLRSCVENIYNSLPKDVQKPRILMSGMNDSAVLCAAFTGKFCSEGMRSWIEANIVPCIEAIDGVSEVIVGGGACDEIQIAFDPEELIFHAQNPEKLALSVNDANVSVPGFDFTNGAETIPLSFDTRLHSLEELKAVPVQEDGRFSTLANLAKVTLSSRVQDEIVRLNGEPCISLSVKCAGNENTIKISSECKKVFESFSLPEENFFVLYDVGKSRLRSIRFLFISLLESLVFIVVFLPLFFNDLRHVLLDSAFLVLTLVWASGVMNLLSVPLNNDTLSAMALSLGLASDSFFVLGEAASSCESNSIEKLIPSVIASFASSVLVLVPLYFMENIVPGIRSVSVTLFCMFFASLVLSVIFYPCFIPVSLRSPKRKRLHGVLSKISVRLCFFVSKKRRLVKTVYAFVFVIPIVLLFAQGKNLFLKDNGEVLSLYCDFDSCRRVFNVDDSVSEFCKEATKVLGVRCVLSNSKKGNASFDLVLDEKASFSKVASEVKKLSSLIPDGFLYVPQFEKKANAPVVSVAFTGKESSVCRRLAREVSGKINFADVILHFKDDERSAFFVPSEEALFRNGYNSLSLGGTLRWLLYGSVCDKWIENGTEYDVRVFGDELNANSAESVLSLKLPASQNGGSSVPLSSLGSLEIENAASRIYRKDGMRCTWISVEFAGGSLSECASRVNDYLCTVEFPEGYGFSFDQSVKEIPKFYRTLYIALFLSVLGTFLLLCALSENVVRSILMVSIIPTSFFLPLLVRFVTGTPLVCADILGLVLLAGISVNNAIYLAGSPVLSVCSRLRSKIVSIILTSLSSFVSSLPVLFLGGDGFSSSLSFVIALGIPFSVFVSIVLFPAFLKKT